MGYVVSSLILNSVQHLTETILIFIYLFFCDVQLRQKQSELASEDQDNSWEV